MSETISYSTKYRLTTYRITSIDIDNNSETCRITIESKEGVKLLTITMEEAMSIGFINIDKLGVLLKNKQ